MSSIYKQSNSPKSWFNTQNIILANITWGVLALLYFLLFSAEVPTEVASPDGDNLRRASWYITGTNIFEALAYLSAGILCLRNWRSRQIVSGRNVWLLFGIGMLSYCLGGIVFGYIEIILQQDPTPSVADIFFVVTYLFVGIGMILAVASRRINLEAWQWIIVLAIAAFGSALAWLISQPDPTATAAATEVVSGWKEQAGTFLNWFYVVSDVLLLIIATSLLLAFWGGRASLPWQMIAVATFSLYIADIWAKWAETKFAFYESGGLLEVGWVLSGVLFGMGAALEFEASSKRSRRERGRKRT